MKKRLFSSDLSSGNSSENIPPAGLSRARVMTYLRGSKNQLFTVLSILTLLMPMLALAQTPQGSLSANGPFCGPGAGMLTFTATAGTGPFTVVYNDGVANRTVTNVTSGTAFNVFTTPVLANTTYNLVSITGSDASIRNAGFTQATATININPQPDLTVTPASQTICSGSNFTTVELGSSFVGATFAWSRDNLAGITGSGGVAAFIGTGNISGTFSNTGTSPGIIGFNVVPTYNGCAGPAKNVMITVNPAPTLTPVSSQTVCAGSTVAQIGFGGTATSFTWTNNNTSIGLGASGTGPLPSFIAANNTTSLKTATIAVTPVYSNSVTCNGVPQNFTIAVNPFPTLSSSVAPPATCSGSVFNYMPASNANGLIPAFSWSRAEVTGISNAANNGNGDISETLINTTTTARDVTYVYTVQGSDGTLACNNSSTYNVVVSVKPTPTAAFSPSSVNKSICSGSSIPQVTITNPNNMAGTTFSWVRTNGTLNGGTISGMPASGVSSPINGVLTNNSTVRDTSKFTVVANNNGCSSGAMFNLIVAAPITENKIIGSQISQVSICGLTRQVTLASGLPKGGNGNFTYQWQMSSPGNNAYSNIPGATDSVLVYQTNGAAYFRRIAYSAGCSDTSDEKSVTAGSGNTSTITKACTGGSGVDISVVASYAGAVYTLQNDRTGVWLDVAGQSPITGTGAAISFTNNKLTGNYRVSIKSGGCTEYVSGTVEILANEIPEKPSQATATPASICVGASTNLIAIVDGPPEANGAVNWYTVPSGGEGISPNPVLSGEPFLVRPDTTTTYYAKSIFLTNGCKSSTRTSVKVIVNPTPVMTSTDSVSSCSGGMVSIPLSDNIGAGTSYTWVANDNPNTSGESLSLQTTAFLNNTILNNTSTTQTVLYTVTPTVTSTGCAGSAQTVRVTVEPASQVKPQALTVCSGETFEIVPVDGGGNIVTPGTEYTWSAPTGSGFSGGMAGSGNSFAGALQNTGNNQAVATYSITPVSGACTGSPFTATITLKPAASIVNQAVSICNGSFALPPFSGNSIVPSGTTYSWPAPTGANISGIATGNAQAVISGNLTNTSNPSVAVTATYTVTPSTAGCEGPPFTLLVNLNFAPPANSAVWTGWVSGDWCDAANWACGIRPTSILNAIIPSGSINQPNITGICNAAVRDIDVQGTATLNLATGTNLNIFGSVNNTDPARYTLNGKVTFAGSNQNIPGFTYNGLGITGGGTKTLVGAVAVNGNIDLDNGWVKTSNSMMLTISATGSVGAGSNLSYIDGPLTRLTNSTASYNFPVGGNGDAHPASITPVDAAASSYTVFYHPVATGGNVPGPDPIAILTNEYWDVMKNSGSNAMFSLYYKNPNGLAANAATGDWSNGMNPCTSCNVAVVAKDGAENWHYTALNPPGGFSPAHSTPWEVNNYVESRQMLVTSGRFSFGYSSNTVLAVPLVSFTGHMQGSTALLQWRFTSLADIGYSELQRSTDGLHFRKVADVTPANRLDYSFTDKEVKQGANFYRLLLRDKAGATAFSRVVLLVAGKNITVIKGLRPTIVYNETFVEIHSAKHQSVQITLLDVTGRKVGAYTQELKEGENSLRINTVMRPRGMYLVHILTQDGVTASYRIIRE